MNFFILNYHQLIKNNNYLMPNKSLIFLFKGTNYSRTAMCHIYVNTLYISTKFGIHVRYVNST